MPYRTWQTNDIPSSADFNNMFANAQLADVAASQACTSTGYSDLATVGPSVTLTLAAGQQCEIKVSSYAASGSAQDSFMGFAVSGAGTAPASDTDAARFNSSGVTLWQMVEKTSIYTAPASGSYTFTAKYRNSTTASYSHANRRIIVRKW
jgi:hypothetical protein